MKKTGKIIIGILTVLPIVYIIYFIASFFNFSNDLENFELMMMLHLFTMVLTIGLLIFYIVNAYNSKKLTTDKRSLWIIILFLGSFIAMAIYWYLYIWKSRPDIVEEKHNSA